MRKTRVKQLLISGFKLVFAVILIGLLIRSEKITAAPFVQMSQIPWLAPLIFGLIFLLIFINNYRWLLLLKGLGIDSNVRQTLPLTFIGLFFNLAMPGSVGGDVIKAYYIAGEHHHSRLKAITSVIMDRIVGFYAMGLLGLGAVLFNIEKILSSHQLRVLAVFIGAIVGGFSLFFTLGFSKTIKEHSWTEKLITKMPMHQIWKRMYDAIHSFRNSRKQFGLGILLSMICHSLIILCFLIISRQLGYSEVTALSLFFIVPLGLVATAIPISPAGIGVGQAVFLTLFVWYFGNDSELGPTLITVFQVVQAIWGLVGAYFYFVRKGPQRTSVMKSSSALGG
ncbi:MAG: flippase-like domain-containing protein [Oligoflexia bacterium]|nr:flippase-like domain-containing protein [Oligoflexia bacterium]